MKTNWIEALRVEEDRLTAERDIQEQALIRKANAEEESISAAIEAKERQERFLDAEVAAISEDYGGPIASIFKAAKGCNTNDLLEGVVVVFSERVKHPVKLIGNRLVIGSAKTNRSTSVPYNPNIPAMRN